MTSLKVLNGRTLKKTPLVRESLKQENTNGSEWLLISKDQPEAFS